MLCQETSLKTQLKWGAVIFMDILQVLDQKMTSSKRLINETGNWHFLYLSLQQKFEQKLQELSFNKKSYSEIPTLISKFINNGL